MSTLKAIADTMFNGDITLFSGPQNIQKFGTEKATFSAARNIAKQNPGNTVIFRGTFPDGRERAQATVSVPEGQSATSFREKLSRAFDVEASDITGNHFTRDNEGHHYLSLTIDM